MSAPGPALHPYTRKTYRMSPSRRIAWMLGIWLLILVVYTAVSLSLSRGSASLLTFGNLVQCVVPLLANAGLLLNAGTPHWRRNLFWMLIALSCTLWMFGLFPHRRGGENRLRFGYLDFVLLLMWWTFFYIFSVLPWMYATPSLGQYNHNYNVVTNIQNMVVVVGFGILALRTRGAWRTVYANLFGAVTLYMLASLALDVASDVKEYYTGSLYDIPLISSFLWFALAGVIAYQLRDKLDAPTGDFYESEPDSSGEERSVWASWLAMAAVISLPLFAIYTLRYGHDTPEVRDFRLMTTLVAALPLALVVFLRTRMADRDRSRLLAQSQQSVENLKRLQAQFVQSEKLVSLGQLAAGAAHEINNPLAAILGFSDLLADDPTIPEKARATAAKIREQARRTKTLVGNLLSFARQVPPERTLLDINTVVNNAVQLRALDLRSGTTQIQLQLESVLPGVRGDGNQLMQVFFNIISNALDAMEAANGGVLTVKTIRDRSNVVVLFSDSGPGIKEPHRVFDPFYTTKPVGKGTGLGLSICFGIIQEHAGKILCYNRQEGGAVFRVELPAVLAAFLAKDLQLTSTSAEPAKPT